MHVEPAAVRPHSFFPAAPSNLDETGLPPGLVYDLVLRAVYYNPQITGEETAQQLCLPFDTVVRPVLEEMRLDGLVLTAGVAGQRGLSPLSVHNDSGNFRYALTEAGTARARDAVERCMYCGPAPVPLAQYVAACQQQSVRQIYVAPQQIREALAELVVSEELLDQLGPAINSGRSLFLYGDAGNGKSALAEAVGRMMGTEMWLPYCLETGGQFIRVYDPSLHTPLATGYSKGADARWLRIRRPVVVVAGEMTLESVDLSYDEVSHIYEAPLQLKANGGVFVVDDLGRQQVSPRQLLNRWIYPLEKRVDYLTLHTGRQVAVPFDELVIFCTNLDPHELADEAFLRRIRHKLHLADPTEEQYREIFRRQCARYRLAYLDRMVDLLLAEFYRPQGRPLRGCHPRDLLDHLADIARYRRQPPTITPELLRLAARTYFVDRGTPGNERVSASGD